MSQEKLFTFANRWFSWSVGAMLGVALLGAMVAFVWLPRAHAQAALEGWWEAICSAAGAPAPFQGAALPGPGQRNPSSVIVSATMMGRFDASAIGNGATLAMACTMCHGARGTSPAGTPHLAGQPASSTYKQLRDFASGHRPSAIMQPLVANLRDQDMRDLAVYYASLERERIAALPVSNIDTPRLVRNGDPMRSIGACASCHSPHAERAATPVLEGLSEIYLREQLTAFKEGRRSNDIHRQMRNAAQSLDAREIAQLSRYYASR